jgi:uncharacterized membrane protein
MIILSYAAIGVICLLVGLGITFTWPLGSPRNSHLASAIVLIVLFVSAGGFLWGGGLIPTSISWETSMLVGLIVGLASVVYRAVHRAGNGLF